MGDDLVEIRHEPELVMVAPGGLGVRELLLAVQLWSISRLPGRVQRGGLPAEPNGMGQLRHKRRRRPVLQRPGGRGRPLARRRRRAEYRLRLYGGAAARGDHEHHVGSVHLLHHGRDHFVHLPRGVGLGAPASAADADVGEEDRDAHPRGHGDHGPGVGQGRPGEGRRDRRPRADRPKTREHRRHRSHDGCGRGSGQHERVEERGPRGVADDVPEEPDR
mmetsp:Transcript_5826/g.16869  ORF Transcript_5826/g.16869 Transcript_5826/m.16869 type:complete len:219 (-) Transcript_5826:1398-2054(-)